MMQMAKRRITFKEQLMESVWELQKIKGELQIASDAALEAQHLAFSKTEKAPSCRQQLEGM